MNWEKADWANPETWPDGPFLAAVQMIDNSWEYFVLTIDECGTLEQDGDAWSAFDVDDIDWIAEVVKPEGK